MKAELGLDYYVARFYDPLTGHFTQADSIIPEPGKAYTRRLSLSKPTHCGFCRAGIEADALPLFSTGINPPTPVQKIVRTGD